MFLTLFISVNLTVYCALPVSFFPHFHLSRLCSVPCLPLSLSRTRTRTHTQDARREAPRAPVHPLCQRHGAAARGLPRLALLVVADAESAQPVRDGERAPNAAVHESARGRRDQARRRHCQVRVRALMRCGNETSHRTQKDKSTIFHFAYVFRTACT